MRKVRQLVGGLSVLLWVGGTFPHAAIGQSQPRTAPQASLSCAVQRQQDVETKLVRLVAQAQFYADAGKFQQSAVASERALRAVNSQADDRLKANLIGQIVGSDDVSISLLGRLVSQEKAINTPILIGVLSQAVQVSRGLSPGFSWIKTRSLTQVATQYRAIEQFEQTFNLLAEATQAAESIQGSELKSIALTKIAEHYIPASYLTADRLLAKAFSLAQKIEHHDPNRKAKVLQAIAIAYAQLGKIDPALEIAQTISGVSYYRSTALLAIVKQYVKANRIEQALQVAQTISSTEIKPLALVEVAAGHARTDQPDQAAQAFSQALQITGVQANSDALTAEIIETYAKAGQRDAALQAAHVINASEAKAIAFYAIALTYAQANQPDKAAEALAQAISRIQVVPDATRQAGVAQPLIERAVKEGQYEQAFRIARAIKEDPFVNRAEILLPLVTQVVRAKQPDLALQIAGEINPQWPDYRNQALYQVIVGYAENGQFLKALQIAQTLKNEGSLPYQVKSLATIARYYSQSNQAAQATSTFAQAQQIASTVRPVGFRAQAIAAIALELFKAKQVELATQQLKQAIQIAKTEDSSSSSYTLRTIAEQLITAEQYSPALQVVQGMPNSFERSSKLQELITAFIEQGQLDQATQVISYLPTPEAQARGLINVASQYIASGQQKTAIALLNQAFAIVQTVSGPESKTMVFKVETDSAGKIISKTEVEDDNDRASLFEDIALRYAELNQLASAHQTVQKIQDRGIQDRLRQRLACYGV